MIYFPHETVSFQIVQQGNKDLHWYHVANCLIEMQKFYQRVPEREGQRAPWTECDIMSKGEEGEGDVLQGYVKMIPHQRSAERRGMML